MPDIHIRREHRLGLAGARRIARQWAVDAETRFAMACTLVEGEASDTLEFARTGVKGALVVAADHFELEARLGFLLGAFSKTIEAEIRKNLDALLLTGNAVPDSPVARKAPGKRSKP